MNWRFDGSYKEVWVRFSVYPDGRTSWVKISSIEAVVGDGDESCIIYLAGGHSFQAEEGADAFHLKLKQATKEAEGAVAP